MALELNGTTTHDNGNGNGDVDVLETKEWLDSLHGVLTSHGPDRARFLLNQLRQKAQRNGVEIVSPLNTPYINTIPTDRQPAFPGNRELERTIKSIARWNAMAMVVKANKLSDGIGGHIATFASQATIYEIGFNHFFRGPEHPGGGDFVYFQGHSTPGIYARAFLEGRLNETHLANFRRELAKGGGLSSYPHPWLMPSFWQFPTVSMGLGPIMAIYQARYLRYLEHRGLKDTHDQRIWCFMGDGECDEPESLGALTLASREKLDNLVFVINCNLQRLDGPVRGNFKIIQELEAAFRGAGWNVIKVIWGSEWDALLQADKSGLLVKRMGECIDGEYQKYSVSSGDYIRSHFFGKYPELLKLVEHLSDEDLTKLKRGGHDPVKVYAAMKAATEFKGGPTVLLYKTVKGYGLGQAAEAKNTAHQQKKIGEEDRMLFRTRFSLPLTDAQIQNADFYKPAENAPEMQYMRERRKALGGSMPQRNPDCPKVAVPNDSLIEYFAAGSKGRSLSTTMAFVDLIKKLMQDKELGKYVVPIIPDEARTFGMEGMFTTYGIYSSIGQLYDPVDAETLVPYKESKNGQIFEEGITEAGSMSTFIAAGTAYSTVGVPTIPFFIYYSMFGFQRVGDLIWAAADMRARGFLLGGTAGRTTLAGEGLQHQDGHSHILASTVPNCKAYDPAFGYEIAVLVQDGIRRMYVENESVFYYLTLGNDNYPMEAMPEGVKDGIIQGMYKFRSQKVDKPRVKTPVHLLGSGAIFRETMKAQEMLAQKYGIPTELWSVTSYKELRRDALAAERWNRLHPSKPAKQSYLEKLLANEKGMFVAASDYMKSWAEMIQRWIPNKDLVPLGTDGFGRSENRVSLRRHFEVDAEFIVVATLEALAKRGEIPVAEVEKAIQELGIDADKIDPVIA